MSDDDEPGGEAAADWPVPLAGVTETLVTTLGPNDRWNVAALGVHAPESADGHAMATTWGNTRTRRNFEARGGGVVQFLRDPELFVRGATEIHEVDDPVLEAAAAWVEVRAERVDWGEEGGTRWEEWRLVPEETAVRERTVPTIDRGLSAVVEATVAASRLDVPTYDTAELLDRLAYLESVVESAGGPADRRAFERLSETTGWRERRG
jgi:hypothetical protein